MLERKNSQTIIGLLNYDHEQHYLELNDLPLHCGDHIELRVFGYWIPGDIQWDMHGWFLLTRDQVGIRLRPGLTVRYEKYCLPAETHLCVKAY